MAAAGDTFIISGRGQRSPHLWVLLWGPVGPVDAFLAVSLTTLRPHSDRTCLITTGEHPFIKHPTCVMYSDARRITQDRLNGAIHTRSAFAQEPVSPELLSRIRAGLLTSPFTPRTIVEMARGASERRLASTVDAAVSRSWTVTPVGDTPRIY